MTNKTITKKKVQPRRYNWTVREEYALQLMQIEVILKQRQCDRGGQRVTKQLILETLIGMLGNDPKLMHAVEKTLLGVTTKPKNKHA